MPANDYPVPSSPASTPLGSSGDADLKHSEHHDALGEAVTEALANGVGDHVADSSDAHDASAISFSPTGTIAATNVQAAIAELGTEDAGVHIADTTDAHAAASISYAGGTGMSATNVEAAIDELATEKANQTALDDAHPWLIDVDVFMTPILQTSWNTIAANASAIHNGSMDSAATQNNEINFDVILGAGTWTVELMHITAANRGIYTLALTGSDIGTIDGYSASPTYNVRSSITSVAVATSGKKRLRLKMATKNGSSSNYAGSIQHLQLRRTA